MILLLFWNTIEFRPVDHSNELDSPSSFAFGDVLACALMKADKSITDK